MKCFKCGRKMLLLKDMPFNEYKIDGYRCEPCKEVFFDPEQAQKVLLINQVKKERFKAKLGRIKSNLILRLPKDIETALNFQQGEEVILTVGELKVARAQ
jgi:DNA-directed RNA polymerase subunit RPC12/RpoP